MDYFTNVLATFLDLGTLWLHCCLRRVRELSDLIKNILICVPKIIEGLKVGLVFLVCSTRRAHIGEWAHNIQCWISVGAIGERENSDWMFCLANESVPENSESDENKRNAAVQTEGSLNVTWSFPIILIHECFHNNMSRLKWLKLSTLLIFKMVSKCCFVYVSYICVYLVYLCFGFSFWMTNIYYW